MWVAGIGGAICLLLHLFVFELWTVPHGEDKLFETSIQPNLLADDHILVRRGSTPKYSELARCQHPTSSGRYVIGRVMGERGDSLEVSDNGVLTNGKRSATARGCGQVVMPHPATEGLITLACGEIDSGSSTFKVLSSKEMSIGSAHALVETGKVYLVSDNRLLHEDSRDFGQVDASTCEHIVFRLYGEHWTDSARRFSILW